MRPEIVALICIAVTVPALYLLRRLKRAATTDGQMDQPMDLENFDSATAEDGCGQTSARFHSFPLSSEKFVSIKKRKRLTAQELIARADLSKQSGTYDQAVDDYLSAQDDIVRVHGADSLEFAELLIRIEDALYARDNEEDADHCSGANWLRALSILERRFGVFDTRLVPVLNRIASAYLLLDKPGEAETIARRIQVIEAREREPHAGSKAFANVPAAVERHLLVTEVGANSEVAGPSDATSETAKVGNFTAVALQSASGAAEKLAARGDKSMGRHDYERAFDFFQQAKESTQRSFGCDSIEVVPILMRLTAAAHALCVISQDDEEMLPIAIAARAMSIMVKEGGMRNRQLLPVLTNMVALSDLNGEHYKAGTYISMIERIERAYSGHLA